MSISIKLQLELKEQLGALSDSLGGSLPIDEAVLDGDYYFFMQPLFGTRNKLRVDTKYYRRGQSLLLHKDTACLPGHLQPR